MKNHKTLIWCTLGALVLSCLSVSCRKSFQSIIKDAEGATFTVYTYDEYGSPSGSGSGFFIEPDGTAVTNFHVLDGSVKALIRTSDGAEYQIDSVLCASKRKDLLLFKVNNKSNVAFPTLKIAPKVPAKGDKVYNIGAPMGLETSVSDGIVASIRTDSHGDIVQTTAPISPGSSGSPMLNDRGEVFAVATFKRKGAENVNFGVIINSDFRKDLDKREFGKRNPKFNSKKSDFVLLNILPDKRSDIMLNAIEFGTTATTLYMTFTNMHLADGWVIWCELGKKDEGFFIEDRDSHQRYYVTSSSLAEDKEHSKSLGFAEVVRFKVHFPVIKNRLSNIDVMWGENERTAHFTDIDLDNYRNNLSVDQLGYQRAYALNCSTEGGDFITSISILNDILEEYPSDVISLNMMAVLSYVLHNNADALYYLSEAIENNPNDELAFLNRAYMYRSAGSYSEAISDMTSAINLCPLQPDYYYYRAYDYYLLKDYNNALTDINKCLDVSTAEDGFTSSPYVYELRAYVNYYLGKNKDAQNDVRRAYKLSSDKELDQRLQNFYSIL